MGLIDAYNLVNGKRQHQRRFTRLSGTVHTRIDRIYSPIVGSNINWQKIGPHPALFTGKGASDHLPVMGTFEVVGHKPGRTYDVRINSELLARRGRHTKSGNAPMEEPHKTGDTGRRHRRRMEQRETGSGNIPSMGDKAKQRATGDLSLIHI